MQNQNINANQDTKQKTEALVQAFEKSFTDTLSIKDNKLYTKITKIEEGACCQKGIIGVKIQFIVYSLINFAFIVAALATSIKKNTDYIALSLAECPNSSNPFSDYLRNYSPLIDNLLGGDIDSFRTF